MPKKKAKTQTIILHIHVVLHREDGVSNTVALQVPKDVSAEECLQQAEAAALGLNPQLNWASGHLDLAFYNEETECLTDTLSLRPKGLLLPTLKAAKPLRLAVTLSVWYVKHELLEHAQTIDRELITAKHHKEQAALKKSFGEASRLAWLTDAARRKHQADSGQLRRLEKMGRTAIVTAEEETRSEQDLVFRSELLAACKQLLVNATRRVCLHEKLKQDLQHAAILIDSEQVNITASASQLQQAPSEEHASQHPENNASPDFRNECSDAAYANTACLSNHTTLANSCLVTTMQDQASGDTQTVLERAQAPGHQTSVMRRLLQHVSRESIVTASAALESRVTTAFAPHNECVMKKLGLAFPAESAPRSTSLWFATLPQKQEWLICDKVKQEYGPPYKRGAADGLVASSVNSLQVGVKLKASDRGFQRQLEPGFLGRMPREQLTRLLAKNQQQAANRTAATRLPCWKMPPPMIDYDTEEELQSNQDTFSNKSF
ncbi:hypothetical protein DIPPA_70131 [Diplonema papillatum]|nr:hypothetical protein DIPPA_70131 [Diplonema papillatum]